MPPAVDAVLKIADIAEIAASMPFSLSTLSPLGKVDAVLIISSKAASLSMLLPLAKVESVFIIPEVVSIIPAHIGKAASLSMLELLQRTSSIGQE
jgi:hypothetical protein